MKSEANFKKNEIVITNTEIFLIGFEELEQQHYVKINFSDDNIMTIAPCNSNDKNAYKLLHLNNYLYIKDVTLINLCIKRNVQRATFFYIAPFYYSINKYPEIITSKINAIEYYIEKAKEYVALLVSNSALLNSSKNKDIYNICFTPIHKDLLNSYYNYNIEDVLGDNTFSVTSDIYLLYYSFFLKNSDFEMIYHSKKYLNVISYKKMEDAITEMDIICSLLEPIHEFAIDELRTFIFNIRNLMEQNIDFKYLYQFIAD